MRYTIDELNTLRNALNDIIGYLTDNSCGDPDCCGGPYYTDREYEEGLQVLNRFKIGEPLETD